MWTKIRLSRGAGGSGSTLFVKGTSYTIQQTTKADDFVLIGNLKVKKFRKVVYLVLKYYNMHIYLNYLTKTFNKKNNGTSKTNVYTTVKY